MKVLIIEDERKIREYLVKHLEPEYYEIATAEDGVRGLELMKMNNYDLVILDNILPGKTGVEVCREARLFGSQTPILILSVLADPLQKVELLNAGADDYLAKPFSFKELKARMNALLRRPQQIEQEVMTLHDIVLDSRSYEVTVSGKEINLTKKEFMLLRYFMRNPGIVLTRRMLVDHVWDMSTDPFSNTIEAHIVSLRKKIGDTRQDIIITVQGRGYKIAK